jgi:hypothetical protein
MYDMNTTDPTLSLCVFERHSPFYCYTYVIDTLPGPLWVRE